LILGSTASAVKGYANAFIKLTFIFKWGCNLKRIEFILRFSLNASDSQTFTNIRDFAVKSDKLGYDAIWVPDHFFANDSPFWKAGLHFRIWLQ